MSVPLSATVAPIGTRVVGVADLQVSSCVGELLITYALGSCLAVCIYDPVAQVGGMLHAMLPKTNPERPQDPANHARFIDTGVPRLFRECYALGAKKERIIIKVAGGARVANRGAEDHFQIGKRNYVELKRLLWRNNVLLSAQDVGGTVSRTVSLHIGTGVMTVKADGVTKSL